MASHSNLIFMQCLCKTRSKFRKSSQNFENSSLYSLHDEIMRNSSHIYQGVTPLGLVSHHSPPRNKSLTYDGVCYMQVFLTPCNISDQKRWSQFLIEIQAHIKNFSRFYLPFNNPVSQGVHVLGIEGMFQCSHLINTAAQGPNIRLQKREEKMFGNFILVVQVLSIYLLLKRPLMALSSLSPNSTANFWLQSYCSIFNFDQVNYFLTNIPIFFSKRKCRNQLSLWGWIACFLFLVQ